MSIQRFKGKSDNKVGRPKKQDKDKSVAIHTTGIYSDLVLIEKKRGNIPELLRQYLKELATNIRESEGETK